MAMVLRPPTVLTSEIPNAPHSTRALVVPMASCSTRLQNPDNKTCVTANDVYVFQALLNPNFTPNRPNEKTLGRNTERSNWTRNFDMNLFKVFRFTERFRLQFTASRRSTYSTILNSQLFHPGT